VFDGVLNCVISVVLVLILLVVCSFCVDACAYFPVCVFRFPQMLSSMEVVFVAVGRFKGVHLDPPARLVIQVGFGPP
jgi:hypothetical protein